MSKWERILCACHLSNVYEQLLLRVLRSITVKAARMFGIEFSDAVRFTQLYYVTRVVVDISVFLLGWSCHCRDCALSL